MHTRGRRRRRRRMPVKRRGMEKKECNERRAAEEETDGGNLCHSDLSLCHAGGAQGFPRPGQRDKLGPV